MQAAQRQPNRSPVVPAAMVLIASVFLGVAYNSASPLGIRSAPSAKGALDSPLSVTRRTGAFNQMMPATAPSPGASSSMGSVYQNETVSVSLAAADAPANRPIPLLSWPEVKALLQAGKIVLVDARGSSFYQADHIPGAVSLPTYSSGADLAAFDAKYAHQTPLVVYCGTAQCPLARLLAEKLMGQLGFNNVSIMPGGYAQYRLAEAQPSPATGGPR